MIYEIILRTIIIYFLIAFIVRILGKREVGQLQVFDLILLLIVADIGAMGIENNSVPFFYVIITLIFLTIIQKLVTFLNLKFPKLRNILDGNPIILVYDGKINLKNMKKCFYTIDDLICQMRNQNVCCISEIKLAILETSGNLSVFKKEDKILFPVIISGKIIKDYLTYLNITEDKIYELLKLENKNINDIYYASYDNNKLIIPKIIN